VTVHGITVEPNMGSQVLLVFGSRISAANQERGVIVQLNFSNLQERTCSPTDDYENWSPQDLLSEDVPCILGETLVFKRRKRGSTCRNGPNFEGLVSEVKCACSRQDFECDYCFEEDATGQCVLSPGCTSPTGPPPQCNNNYTVTKGYRYVPGTKCDPNGRNSVSKRYAPTVLPCPTGAGPNPTISTGDEQTQTASNTKSNGGVVAAVVIILLFVLIGGGIGVLFFLVKTKRIHLGDRWAGLFGKTQKRPKETSLDDVPFLSDF